MPIDGGEAVIVDQRGCGPPSSPLFVGGGQVRCDVRRDRPGQSGLSPGLGRPASHLGNKSRILTDNTRVLNAAEQMVSLEETHAKLLARKTALDIHLKTLQSRMVQTQDENLQIKRLVSSLNVCKEDFTQLHAPPERREEAMLAVGTRLLNGLGPAEPPASWGSSTGSTHTKEAQLLLATHAEAAQVAAAALVACGNDTAAAVVALLEAAERGAGCMAATRR